MASSSSLQSSTRVERPGEDCEETRVEQLHDGQQAERHSEKRRGHRPRPRRQEEQQSDAENSLQRDADECSRSKTAELIRSKQSEQHQHAGQRCGQPMLRSDARGARQPQRLGVEPGKHVTLLHLPSGRVQGSAAVIRQAPLAVTAHRTRLTSWQDCRPPHHRSFVNKTLSIGEKLTSSALADCDSCNVGLGPKPRDLPVVGLQPNS